MENLGITIEFQGKELNFDTLVSNINKSINILKKDVSMLNKQLKLDPTNVELLTKKIANLKKQEELAKKLIEEYSTYLKKLNDEGVSPFSEEWQSTVKKIEKANDKLVGIQKQLQKVGALSDDTKTTWEEFGETLTNAGEKLEAIGNKLMPLSNASQNFLRGAIDGAIEFDDAFADVEKTVNASIVQFEEIRVGLRELATELPTSASELAHIAGLAGQMNVPADQVVEFTRAMVDFANSTDITAEQATTDIAQIYNVIGKGGDFSTLDALLSTIVELGNNTATTESAIVEMFRNVSAASSRVGMTEAQMVALAATLSSLGLDKGGASAISKIMTNIDMAVDTNSESLQDWADVAGVSVKEFKELWGNDASAGLLSVVQGIARINEEGGSMNATLEELGVNEIRQIDTLSRLTNANAEYSKNIELANNAYADGTALSKEAAKRYATVASQIEILKNNFMEFALAIGDIMLPYVEWLIQSFKQIADWMNSLSPHTKMLIMRILGITAVLAPLLLNFGKLLMFLPTIKTNITLIVQIVKTLITAVTTFKTIFMGLLTNVADFLLMHFSWVAAITLLITLFVGLYESCEPFRAVVDKIIRKMQELWIEFKQTNWIEALGEKFGWIGEIIGLLIETIKTLLGWFGKLVSKVLEFLGLQGSIGSALGSLSTGVRGVTALDISGMRSGGMMSGSYVFNNSFTVTTNNVTENMVRRWANMITDQVNENLGRMV